MMLGGPAVDSSHRLCDQPDARKFFEVRFTGARSHPLIGAENQLRLSKDAPATRTPDEWHNLGDTPSTQVFGYAERHA